MLGAVLRPAAFVFAAVFLFSSAHLSSITLAAIEASRRGISELGIGLFTALPFLGLLTGALFVPKLLLRTKHVRLIAIATSGCSLSLMFLPYIESIVAWAFLRFLYGFAAAGVWLCCDLWMAHISDPSNRGRILAFYQITVLSGTAIGQLLLVTSGEQVDFGFVIASAIMVGAVIPVCCTKMAEPPAETHHRKLSVHMAIRLAPLPLVGSLIAGLCFSNYAFILLHFTKNGVAANQIATLGLLIVASGTVGQLVVGYLSDRVRDRRSVMQVVAVLSISSLLLLAYLGTRNWSLTLVLGMLYGGCIVTLYPLNVALAGDFVSKELFGPMAAKNFLAISIGNSMGPMLGGIFLSFLPNYGTFVFLVLTLLLLIVATLSPKLLAQHQPVVKEDFSPLMPMGVNPELTDPRSESYEHGTPSPAPPDDK